MAKPVFEKFFSAYTNDSDLVQRLWTEIEEAYGHPERHFHNLSHLAHLFTELSPLKKEMTDCEAVLAALFYHDFAYNTTQYVLANDNEERSAEAASKALRAVGWPAERIALCNAHILATKKHALSNNADTNLFTDADLAILGQPWEDYLRYSKAIRKEYTVYPDPIYQSGRAGVLKGFLRMENVYKTDYFRQRYEASARENMERELEILSML